MSGRDWPAGVPREWRRDEPELAGLGARLRRECQEVLPAWGDPLQASVYYDQQDARRYLTAEFANGMRLSICYRFDGWQVESFDVVGPL
ncbi:hypothetical protein D2V17_14270 [Aurantiacibacter xanthus]|uniref:Uncharacterized protein n=1 Tax=Aurantiacibacter xanthus TaxID=1784712 RepID=A0A3A1P201_9SPHN|nr:hypothetical protein [Aurantiacibacter xanthus]RIV82964.1 hypothetical protein D2V17_14270 [Aurantiacibacter xanthus]